MSASQIKAASSSGTERWKAVSSTYHAAASATLRPRRRACGVFDRRGIAGGSGERTVRRLGPICGDFGIMDNSDLIQLHVLLQRLLKDHEFINGLSLLEQREIAGASNTTPLFRTLNLKENMRRKRPNWTDWQKSNSKYFRAP